MLADRHGQPELTAEAGLALVDRVARMAAAPLVFAGASHHVLMTLAIKELKLPTPRLIGSAPVAAAAAARALMAPALDASPVDVDDPDSGPAPILGAGVGSGVLGRGADRHAAARRGTGRAGARRQLATGRVCLASAASAVIRAILTGSRRRFCCFQATPFGSIHPVVFAAPVTLGPSGIATVVVPELTPRQRVGLESTVLARS